MIRALLLRHFHTGRPNAMFLMNPSSSPLYRLLIAKGRCVTAILIFKESLSNVQQSNQNQPQTVDEGYLVLPVDQSAGEL